MHERFMLTPFRAHYVGIRRSELYTYLASEGRISHTHTYLENTCLTDRATLATSLQYSDSIVVLRISQRRGPFFWSSGTLRRHHMGNDYVFTLSSREAYFVRTLVRILMGSVAAVAIFTSTPSPPNKSWGGRKLYNITYNTHNNTSIHHITSHTHRVSMSSRRCKSHRRSYIFIMPAGVSQPSVRCINTNCEGEQQLPEEASQAPKRSVNSSSVCFL